MKRLQLILMANLFILFFVAPSELRSWDPDTDLSNASASFLGENAFDKAGRSVASVGDVNGDGYDDLLVGANYNDDGSNNAGQVYLILGKASGWGMDNSLSNADASFVGEDADDYAGWAVSSAGDVNGDGYDDFLIGASWDEDGGFGAGQVYLVLGKTSGWNMDTSLSTADASFIGEAESNHAGHSVASAGDVNGDGYDDFLIGADGWNGSGGNQGQVYLILGKASGWSMDIDLSSVDASFIGEIGGDYAGHSIAAAGDVNGDGYTDFVIGANLNDEGGYHAGQVYLILGKTSGWAMDTPLSSVDASFLGSTDDIAGRSVSSAGDVNGDGYDDFIIGASRGAEGGGDQTGKVYLILGMASGWTMDTNLSYSNASFLGEDVGDRAGYSVASAGDVNGDGYDDFVIGAPWDQVSSTYKGQVYLIFGKASSWSMDTNLSTADASFWGESGDYAGYSVASAGDVNGDAFNDFIIGAYRSNDGGQDQGEAYLVLSDQTGATNGTYKNLISSDNTPPVKFPNADVILDFSAATSSNGYVTVTEHNNQNPPDAGSNVFNRYWTISGSGLSDYNYDLTFKYNDGEIIEAGVAESDLKLAYKNGGSWSVVSATVDAAHNRISATGLTHFSDWAVGSEAAFAPESFTDISASLTEVSSGSAAWGDYDEDGDLDILLTGVGQSRIYRNDSGSFVDISASLMGVSNSSAAWGDYDSDGDLDLILIGYANSGNVSKIYRNDGGSFVDISASLIGVKQGSVAWGDYDNDGDLDILLTGSIGSAPYIAKVYRNDGGSFEDIGASLSGVINGSVAWGDYDNDGDLDILLTGNTGSSVVSKIYRNDGGSFADVSAPLAGNGDGSCAWGDYDNDGDLDILLAGFPHSKIYRNDGGNFEDIGASLIGVSYSSAAWGDYDNDGDLDILLTGYDGFSSICVSIVYRNDNGSFVDISASLAAVERASIAWGDYDNDGDLDILLTGRTDSWNSISKIYRNNIGSANTVPSAATNLACLVTGSSVTLNWDKATDAQTAQDGLTYNLRVGTSAGGVQEVSPMADVSNGYRKVPKLGNTNHNNSWTIKNLSGGTYYWSVQAIDNGFAGSEFADEQSFIISSDPTPPAAVTNLSVSSVNTSTANLTWTAPGDDGDQGIATTYDIRYSTSAIDDSNWDSAIQATGEPIPQAAGFSETFTVTGLSDTTTYYFAMKTADEVPNWSGLSNVVSETTKQLQFTDIFASLTEVSSGSAAWGDYDEDGDLDILLTGVGQSRIYRNDSGSFVDISASLMGVSNSSAAWGDYDSDGDLDLILIGYANSGNVSKIYRNDGGSFVDISASLIGVKQGSVAWGDYDNDGDLDILLTGSIGSAPYIAKVYRNDGGSFEDIGASLSGVINGSVAWGDYDNDGDLDILLTGNTGSSVVSKIYRNDGGSFADVSAPLAGNGDGSCAWGDYDNDGDLDILLAGFPHSKIYRNDGGNFEDIGASLIGVSYSSAAWGDYDNDGDLDILLTGYDGFSSICVSIVYRNDNGSFVDISASLAAVERASIAWGDYDNDGDLDILLTGRTDSWNSISKIYRNNIGSANTVPSAATNLACLVTGSSVTLNWDKATDAQTAQDGLTYNLRVGTSAGGVQEVSPMADVSNGYRKVPKLGNTNHNNSWTIGNLADGTYYWSIQAIDNAFAGSAFAAEQNFIIGGDNTSPSTITNLSVSAVTTTSATLTWTAPGDDGSTGTATTYDIRYFTSTIDTSNWDTATQATSEPAPQVAGSSESFTVSGLTENTTYYFAMKTADEVPNWSVLSNVVNGSTLSPPLANSAWPKFHHDNKNTGQSVFQGSQTATLRWSYLTGGYVYSSPTIGQDGTIYTGSEDGKVYAVNPDGTPKWIYTTGGNIYSSCTIGNDNTIYVGSYDGKLYALNPNGTLKWTYSAGKNYGSSPAIGDDNTIYVGSYGNNLVAINPDGTGKWSYPTGGWIWWSSPAIADDGTIYIGCEDGKLYAVKSDGTLKWTYAASSSILSSPAVGSDGTVYIGSVWGDAYPMGGNIYAIDSYGNLKWKYGTDGRIQYSSPAIAADGTIYIGTEDRKLYALRSDGTLKWTYETGSFIRSSPAIDHDGTIYVGSWDDKLYAINSDGTLEWSYQTGNDIESPPSIGNDGTIYLGSLDSRLYAIGTDATAPSAINNLAVNIMGVSSATLTWTAPGDDGDQGTATTYDIRYSTSTITEGNWDSANQVDDEPSPQAAGSTETFSVTGLSQNTTYYFGMKTADEMPNWSGLSNVASGTTEGTGPMTGTKTIGGTSPNYSTITAAVSSLNIRGVGSGGVTFLIRNGTYNESAPLTITASGTASNPITFKPDAGATVVVSVAGTATEPFAIRLDGADYVTFDGSNSGGSSQDMTIQCTGESYGKYAVYIYNNADNNTIKNCTVKAHSESLPSENAGISIDGANAGADYNIIENCNINTSYCGIVLGSATYTRSVADANNEIKNCLIDVYVDGVRSWNQNGLNICGNDIQVGDLTSSLPRWGINIEEYIVDDSHTVTIYNNRIHDIQALEKEGIGSGFGIGGIRIWAGSVVVYNNMIYNFAVGENGTRLITVWGICQYGASCSYYHNSIYLNDVNPNETGSTIAFATWGVSVLKNNIIYNANSNEGSGYYNDVVLIASSGNITSDYNDLYKVGDRPFARDYRGGQNFCWTFDEYQTETGLDVHSISADPGFVSDTDLHISPSTWVVNGQALSLGSSYGTDFDGDSRNTDTSLPVDIGADEYTPTGSATLTASGSHSNGGTETFTYTGMTGAEIVWGASGTLPTFISHTYNPGSQPANLTTPVYRYWDFAATGGSGWSGTIRLYYSVAELAGISESELGIFKSDDGGTSWSSLTTTLDTSSHYAEANVTSFSRFGLSRADQIPPSDVTDLAVSTVTATSATLTWTAPGDDSTSGTATTYDIRYFTSSITTENWDSATQATGEPSPSVSGSAETFTVSNLSQNTSYYFAVKTGDEAPNWSEISNVVSAKTGTGVSGDITSNTTWILSNSPYIATGDVVVRNVTLTIEAGVSVLFLNNVGLRIGYRSGPYVYPGRLIAEGNSENPITFTSQSGNTNNWDGIYFCDSSDYGSNTSTMTYCIVENAGQEGWGKNANIYCYKTSQPTLTNCTIRNATGYGIYLYQSDVTVNSSIISSNTEEGIRCEDCAPTISGSTFQNNGSYPIHFDAEHFIAHSNNAFSENGTEGIAVDGGTIGGSGGTWPFDGNEPYIVLGDITVGSYYTTLTIKPGVTVKFSSGTGMRFGYNNGIYVDPGGINAIGKIDSLITFTSLSGNTNDWDGLYFSDWSDKWVDSSVMSYCLVEKAGQSGWGQSANIYCNQTTTPTIDHCTITNAAGVGIYSDASSITIHESEIFGNSQYGVYHSGSGSVDAEHNWWGDSSGPLDDSDDTGSGGLYNPSGTGDKVSDGIDYNPWIRQDTETVSSTGSYSFNESLEGGDGHDVDMNFNSLTGSGNVSVRQSNEQPPNAPCFNVCGHYLIIEIDESITSFSANITFHYTDADATGYTESAAFFGIAKFNSSTNTWQWLGGTVDADNNTVTVSGVTSFSTFALFRRIFGDITGDGYVDAADLQRLGDCWHETNSGEFTAGVDARFFNYNKNTDGGNQIIDAADLQVFGDCWHNGIPGIILTKSKPPVYKSIISIKR